MNKCKLSIGFLLLCTVSVVGLTVGWPARSYATVPGINQLVSDNVTGDATGGNDNANTNGYGLGNMISGDGRAVAFDSRASNLVANDTNNMNDIFVRDLATDTTERVSFNADGTQSTRYIALGGISDTGRYVVYMSAATQYGPNSVYEYDRQTNQTTVLSLPASPYTTVTDVSSDGRFVVATVQFGEGWRVAVTDREDSSWQYVDTNGGQTMVSGQNGINAHMDCDGAFIVFDSNATGITNDTSNGYRNVFLLDRRAGSKITKLTTTANADSVNPTISCNGNYVTYVSKATNLTTDTVNGSVYHLFKYDRIRGVTELVDKLDNDTPFGATSFNSGGRIAMADNDGNVAFASQANNVGASANTVETYIRSTNGTTQRLSRNANGDPGDGNSLVISISSNGKLASYGTSAHNLLPNDNSTWSNVYTSETGN